MKPTKSILDPSFSYTNAARTDIRKTFAKWRREQEKSKALPPVDLPGTRIVVALTPKDRKKA
jgi:hypothetical protein